MFLCLSSALFSLRFFLSLSLSYDSVSVASVFYVDSYCVRCCWCCFCYPCQWSYASCLLSCLHCHRTFSVLCTLFSSAISVFASFSPSGDRLSTRCFQKRRTKTLGFVDSVQTKHLPHWVFQHWTRSHHVYVCARLHDTCICVVCPLTHFPLSSLSFFVSCSCLQPVPATPARTYSSRFVLECC